MNTTVQEKLWQRVLSAPLTWDPLQGGKRAWVCFDDAKDYDLGADPDGSRFVEITARMVGGYYYPADAITVTGSFRSENRTLRAGDRLLQLDPLLGKWGGPTMPAGVQMFVVDQEPDRTKIGYVTTHFHFGRGIWSSELRRKDGRLTLHVTGTTSPHHWLFWLGLPYARALQKRAWRRAVETFKSI